MQTFLPYPSFEKSAKVLDYRRLGKQRVEAMQIINILVGNTLSKGWQNHPAVLMWKGYENALKLYMNICIIEWRNRGYNNSMKLHKIVEPIIYPHWFNNNRFHSAHRSNLLRKDFIYYSQFRWSEATNIPYYWPETKRDNMTYPIVEYAQKIGKNTADFTTMDMVNFNKWWMIQPNRVIIEQEIKQQLQNVVSALKENQLMRKGEVMTKRHTTASFQKAQISRLAEHGIESPINDGQEDIVIHTEVVCSMDLTAIDVAALLFSIARTLSDYEMGTHAYGVSLLELKAGLEEV